MRKRVLAGACCILALLFLSIITSVSAQPAHGRLHEPCAGMITAPRPYFGGSSLATAGRHEEIPDIRTDSIEAYTDHEVVTGPYYFKIDIRRVTVTGRDFRNDIKINSLPCFNGSKYKEIPSV